VTRKLAFIDSGLLIAAARGKDELSNKALEVLDDPERDFVTSDFVRLEVLPKAIYNKQAHEVQFYETFFQAAQTAVPPSTALVDQAQWEAEQAGLSALDALHVAAAKEGDCRELITAEAETKPLFRVKELDVITIRPRALR